MAAVHLNASWKRLARVDLLQESCVACAIDGNVSFAFTWEMRRKVQLGTGSPITVNSLRKRNSLTELSAAMHVCVCLSTLIQRYFPFHLPFVPLCCCLPRLVLVRSAAVASTHNK